MKSYLIHALILVILQRIVSSSSLYPISNLEASLAASTAQGTTIAIRSKEGIVLISMSPKEQSSISCHDKDSIDKKSQDDSECFIPITRRGDTICKSLKILQEKYGLAISVTGFAPDCNYVTRYAAGAISEHEFIYGGVLLGCQSLVRDTLAPLLREKTMGNGNRPLGIQVMVMGEEKVGNGEQTIATLDPSGNTRYWTQHAVIGKHSEIVKKYLTRVSSDSVMSHPQQISNWQDALKLGLSAMLEGIQESSKNIQDISTEEIIKDLDCFIFWKHASSSFGKCATIKRAWVSKTLDTCIEN
jgi:20S proteasome alpha/beta subunit